MAASDLLSDKGVKAAVKAAVSSGTGKRISDGGGLYIETRPSGAGWWRLRYRFNGKEGMLSLGTYPTVSLRSARERRDLAKKQIADGVDPSGARKAEKAELALEQATQALAAEGKPVPGSFEFVAREWLATVHAAKVTPGHADKTRVRLEQNVFPWLGSKPIGSIEAPDLLQCLRRIESRGVIDTTHRVKFACGQVFRFGIATGRCVRNPAADLREALRPVVVKHYASIIDPSGVGKLLRDLAAYQGHPVTRAALLLSPLLLLRPGELRQMQWAWVGWDSAMLTVPSAVMKRKKADKAAGPPHHVPLADQALAVLQEIRALTGHGKYVFPSLLTGERCMSENTVRGALRRMGYTNEEQTAHGFRAMARTMIAERLGGDPEVIEAQLAHAKSGALGGAYDRAQYLEQRRRMMKEWADYIDRLRSGATVISMRAA